MTRREAAKLLLEQSDETEVVGPLKMGDHTVSEKADSQSDYNNTKSGSSDMTRESTQDVSVTTVTLETSDRISEKKIEKSRGVEKEYSKSVDDSTINKTDMTLTEKSEKSEKSKELPNTADEVSQSSNEDNDSRKKKKSRWNRSESASENSEKEKKTANIQLGSSRGARLKIEQEKQNKDELELQKKEEQEKEKKEEQEKQKKRR